MDNHWERYFPEGTLVNLRSAKKCEYGIQHADGYGVMTTYEVMSGVVLVFNDFHTQIGFNASAPKPGVIEVNHCLRGRFEGTMADGRALYLGAGDFAINDMAHPTKSSAFTYGEYYGISLIIELKAAERFLDQMMGAGTLRLSALFERLLWEDTCLIIRTDKKIQHIFSELYDEDLNSHVPYLKLKIVELLLFLDLHKEAGLGTPRRYYTQNRHQRIQEIEKRLTANLRESVTIKTLADEYNMSQSALEKHFKTTFGQTPHAYLKQRRMDAAALLLSTTKRSVSDIAFAVGYQNASKFATAFAEQYGLSPRDYRKGVIME